MKRNSNRPKLMVSSTVQGIEELLDRVYAILHSSGYEVWMSHKGTLPVSSDKSILENCLEGVKNCDLFLGIITADYGHDVSGRSITHREILEAIKLKKSRWFLAHEHVVFAHTLLKNLDYGNKSKRQKLELKKTPAFTDLRILDLYEETIKDSKSGSKTPLAKRQGAWVQKFRSDQDASIFIASQFFHYYEAEEFIRKKFPPQKNYG